MADNLKSPKVLSALALVLAGSVTGGAFAHASVGVPGRLRVTAAAD